MLAFFFFSPQSAHAAITTAGVNFTVCPDTITSDGDKVPDNITATSATLYWKFTNTSGATQYKYTIQVDEAADNFASVKYTYNSAVPDSASASYAIPAGSLDPGTTYKWRFLTYYVNDNNNYIGPVTQTGTFTTLGPTTPSTLGQFKNDGVTAVGNGNFLNAADTGNIKLQATTTEASAAVLTLYFQLLQNSGTFDSGTGIPTGSCSGGTAYGSCSGSSPAKVWSVASGGSVTSFTNTPLQIPVADDATGYKWQVKACDGTYCSNWKTYTSFVSGTDPNFKVDTATPSAPAITHIAGDEYINDSEKAAITVTGTAEAGSTVTVTLKDVGDAHTVSNTGTATGGNYSINVVGTSLNDGTITPYVHAADAAGNSSADTSAPTAVKDVLAPGSSISYTGGYYTAASVALTVGDGTETGSGVNTASRTVQRKSATLSVSDGTCGSYGSFGTITPTGSYPNFTDTAVTSGNCYQYQYLVSDNAGNQIPAVSANEAKVDTSAQAPSGVAPASDSFFPTYTANSSVAFTLAEKIQSGSTIKFTRTGGTADGTSPHTCTLVGTALNNGAHNAFDMSNTTNSCSEGATFSLVNGSTYTINFHLVDLAGNIYDADEVTNATLDSSPPTFSSVAPADNAYINNVTNQSAIRYAVDRNLEAGTSTILFHPEAGGTFDPDDHTCVLTGSNALQSGAARPINLATDCTEPQVLVSGAKYTMTISARADISGAEMTPIVVSNLTYQASAQAAGWTQDKWNGAAQSAPQYAFSQWDKTGFTNFSLADSDLNLTGGGLFDSVLLKKLYGIPLNPTSDADFNKGAYDSSVTELDTNNGRIRLKGLPWYDSAWQYKKAISVTNSSGSGQTNYDVLLVLDTASLRSAGKLQDDCDDLRFTGSDSATPVNYWIESGCNSATTQIWIRIPSLPTGGTTIYMYYGNQNATSGTQSWNNSFILPFKSACPSGWTAVGDLNNDGGIQRFPYGASSYGTRGGSDTHAHNVSGSTGQAPLSSYHGLPGAPYESMPYTHTHSFSATSSAASNNPPYVDVVFCAALQSTLTADALGIFNVASLPGGWTEFSALNGYFPRGATVYTGVQNGAHAHSVTGNTNSYSAESNSNSTGATAVGSHSHTFSFNTNGPSVNPPYYTVKFATTTGNNLAAGTLSLFSSATLPPLGWTNFASLNGRFMQGSSTPGTSGGSADHYHSYNSSATGNNSPAAGNIVGSGGNQNSTPDHNHSIPAGNTSTATNVYPRYLEVVYGQRKSPQASMSVSATEESAAGRITETTDADFNAGTTTNILVSGGAIFPKKPNGYACSSSNYCQSGNCDNGICFQCGTSTITFGSLTYGTVSVGSQCWFDRNLGATLSLAYGWLYQWGRGTDGHQITTSSTTGTSSSSDTPGHSNFIAINSSPFDWRNPQNGNLWGSANGYINNPCPSGWHVPTQSEWSTAMTSLGLSGCSSNCLVNAANSSLKLPAAGYRSPGDGVRMNEGVIAILWSSTPSGSDAYLLNVGSDYLSLSGIWRGLGASVRCLKD